MSQVMNSSPSTEERAQPWWHDLYDDLLADVLLERGSLAEADASAGFLVELLKLSEGARVFDQCCGIGSLSLPLAARGYRVVGVDLAQGYIERGRLAARSAGLQVDLHQGDAFEFVPAQPCAAAFNWWTSFGYAQSDVQNRRMLERAFESLVPGGRFALDYMNVPGVLRNFRSEVTIERMTPQGTIELTRQSRYEPATGMLYKTWRYCLPSGQSVEHPSAVRAYTPPELTALLRSVGFEQPAFYGDEGGGGLELDSPRCIAVCRRPC